MGWDHQLVYFWCLQPAGLKTKTSPPIPIKRCYVLRGLAHDTKITVPWRTSDQFWFWNRGFAIFRIKPKIWFWIVLYIFECSNLQSYSLSVGLSQNFWDIHIALGVFLKVNRDPLPEKKHNESQNIVYKTYVFILYQDLYTYFCIYIYIILMYNHFYIYIPEK